MGKGVLIVKNITREGPGILADVLSERGIQATIVDLDAGGEFPPVENYAAVIVLGGPDSANDETQKMQQELAHIKEVLAAGIPYLGICLGLQTLVKAAGGSVVKNSVKEIGFRDPEGNRFTVELTEVGKTDPLLKNIETHANVFHLHGETVTLTDTMQLLASGKFCTNQIVKVADKAYGIQCHFELTPEMFTQWLAEDSDLRTIDQDSARKDFEETKGSYTAVGRQLFENFLTLAGL